MTEKLSRRERQIMDAVYQRGSATAGEIQEALPDAPSYSAVRTLLRILEEKGHLRHEKQGARYLYLPVQAPQMAARSALAQVVRTFFGGSVTKAVAALLENADAELNDEELARLTALVEQARSVPGEEGDE